MTNTIKKETITMNQSNWSGEESTIVFNHQDDGSVIWEQYGYEFKAALDDRIVDEENPKYSFTTYSIKGDSWDEPLFNVSKFDEDESWTALQYDIIRSGKAPHIAAAKMIFMTV